MPRVHAPAFFPNPCKDSSLVRHALRSGHFHRRKLLLSGRTSARYMGLTFSFRINGGRAADAWDMNPSLVGEAQKRDTVATQPSDLGRVATDSLAICKKSAKEPDSIPFGGGSKKLVAFRGRFQRTPQCPTMPRISPSALRLGDAIRNSP